VWEWNGTAWTEHLAGFAPALRSGHELTYDGATGQTIMYGGWNVGPVFFDDLWTWNGSAWTDHGNATAPAGRAWYASAYDESAGELVVHGGSDGVLEQDTWRALVTGLPNDDPAGATPVVNGMIGFDNRCAANGPSGCAGDRDLWYRYTATVSGMLSASIPNASFSAQVAIVDAANPATIIACGTGPQPTATTLMLPGDYLIRVGSAPAANGGVGDLVVNGQPQPCPPVFNLGDPSTYKHRLYEVTGTANGVAWSWSIHRGSDLLFDLHVPGVPAGGSAADLAAAFVAAINAHSCATNRLLAAQINPPYQNMFRVVVGGQTSFDLCVGPAAQLPTCCPSSVITCPFNPDLGEILLSGEDCNKNGMDDTIDILMGDGTDINDDGILDACQACTNDLDGDGAVGFPDLLAVLASWGPCEGCPADLDHDGTVAFPDLLAVLSSWGPCP